MYQRIFTLPPFYEARILLNDMKTASRTSERGQVLIGITILFTAAVMIIVLGVLSPTIRELQIASDFHASKQSYYAAEAGGEDVYYRIRKAMATSFPLTLTIASSTATVTVTPTSFTEEQILSRGNDRGLIRSVIKYLTVTDGFDFSFALQSGLGGIYLFNNAAVNGNIYSSGVIQGANSNANSYNLVKGSIVSAGASGLVDKIHATSTVYSHTITNATIDKDAYYQTFRGATSSVTVSGTSHPNSADQPLSAMPVSDSLITQWESDAATGGTATCTAGTYTISSSATIGPKKIPCNLVISGNGTIVTLTGTLWVVGNISVTGSGGSGVQMKVSDTIGDKSVSIIADDSSSPTTKGVITIDGNSNFYGSTGNSDSYVMFISMNTSAETGGSNLAINVVNGAAGNILIYAPHGEIELQNNVNLREVTSYKLTLINNTVVNYAIGLAQTLFTSGSGGSWKIKRWQEI